MSGPFLSDAWKGKVRDDIRNGAELNIAFIFMNTLAATIATYGLFANSPAVIIGAMIVAMLLGPIAGVALSLVDSDMSLLFRSILTLVAGSIAVMITSLVISLFHPDIPITNEIMARTSPNLIDLMIALAGGAAGAYASVSPRLSVAFVGVAIATALVPPLCSAVVLFAHGEISLGLGACLLTFTNMVAIQFACSLVFWFTGFRKVSHKSELTLLTFLKRNTVSITILCVLAVVLTGSLRKNISKQLFETTTRFTLAQEFNSFAGNYLVEVRFETKEVEGTPGKTVLRAVVRGPVEPSADDVRSIEDKLPSPPDGTEIELRVRFVKTIVITRDGHVYDDIKFGEKE
jgi:uncharacterized hydrophobic protein (TIGR00271 family)